jgi:hypothetical protein
LNKHDQRWADDSFAAAIVRQGHGDDRLQPLHCCRSACDGRSFKRTGLNLLALHPTVKPVPLIAGAIRDCSHRQGLVLDPFASSGRILIAAESTGRCARAMQLSPHYVDVAVRRWQRLVESAGPNRLEVRYKAHLYVSRQVVKSQPRQSLAVPRMSYP